MADFKTTIIQGNNGTNNQIIKIDSATRALLITDYAHHEVHAGDSFFYCDIIALGNGASQDYLITTPNTTKWGHFGYDAIFGDGAGTLSLYETADRTGSIAQTIYNRNRNSVTAATITIHKGQSGGTTDGTLLCSVRVGSGKSSGGDSGSKEEVILKQNTKYIIRVTNNMTSTNNTTIEFRWYEHTNETA